ncbi:MULTISPECIES: sporulation protein YunB [Sutcliffiella]|uniref:sporulation protein YunB n=1 Tax=Sutcliffiella TaxID=2837511 RepID=UPI0022DD1B4E|nr:MULTISPECIES: sporulation protein YunB [Sutcliffiella]MED4016672.1 sporulation protein YunB [Sutcliffiella cohnii]WBL14353.1 sporulation protein YunB [Sutcliffiella sp. NC1]
MAKFRRMRPRRGPLPFRYVFLLSFVFFIFSTVFGLYIVNKGIEPALIRYAESQTRRISTLVINNAINKKIVNTFNQDENLSVMHNGDSISFSPELVLRIQSETVNVIERYLRDIGNGELEMLELPDDIEIETSGNSPGIVFHVPLGQATNNALLGNLGPKIPVRFLPIGDVNANVNTEVIDVGINNAWIEVSIHIEVHVQVIIPFSTGITTVQQDVPIIMHYEKGKVPNFYQHGGGMMPPVSVPIEEVEEVDDKKE